MCLSVNDWPAVLDISSTETLQNILKKKYIWLKQKENISCGQEISLNINNRQNLYSASKWQDLLLLLYQS